MLQACAGCACAPGTDIGWAHTYFSMGQAGVRQAFGTAASLEVNAYYWRAESDIGSVLASTPAPAPTTCSESATEAWCFDHSLQINTHDVTFGYISTWK